MPSSPVGCSHEPAAGTAEHRDPPWEVADVFHPGAPNFLATRSLPSSHLRVVRDIMTCRTAALGGHLERCSNCGFQRHAYNSCRNRHCPKCLTLATARWLEKRKAELLPVPYFHNVFTLPHELNPLVLANMRVALGMLFRAVSRTLLQFGRRNLGGRIGFTAVLHTWDQTLNAHFHLHCVITGGALTPDRTQWVETPPGFLFPVEPLSIVFQAKFLDALQGARDAGDLVFPGQAAEYASVTGWRCLIKALSRKSWVVYSKAPFGGPQQVLDYLGRYTHRVAISNHRIRALDGNNVTFTYRDRRRDDRARTMTLDLSEFIRRFLLHVLPSGFMRIRHYGFPANRCKAVNLQICRVLLGQPTPEPETGPLNAAEVMLQLAGIDLTRCPRCGATPLQRISLAPDHTAWDPLQPAVIDSS